jgi:hypothetical protein
MKKESSFKLRSGNKPSPAELSGISPMKNDDKKKKKKKKTFVEELEEAGAKENLPFIQTKLTKKQAEQQKEIFKKMPFLGPAPNNPKQGSLINVPKLGRAKKSKK